MSQLPESSLPPTTGDPTTIIEQTSLSFPPFPSDTASSSQPVPSPEPSSSSVETPISASATSPSESVTQPASSSSDSTVASVPTSSSSTSVLPVGSISSHKSANAGAIAGAVIGALGVLALLVGAFLLYRRRRRARPLLPTRAASNGSDRSSSERKGPPMSGRPSHPHHNTSVGTLDGTAEDTLDGHPTLNKNLTWGRSASGEKAAYLSSPPMSTDEHGLSTSVGSTGADTLAGSADLAHVQAYYTRSRHGSAQSSVTTIADQQSYAPEPVSRSTSRRRSSRRDSAGPGWSAAIVAAPRPTGAAGERERERERVLSAPAATTYPPGAPRRHASANSVGSVLEQHARASSFERSTTSLAGAGGSNPQLVAAPTGAGVARTQSTARRPKKKPVPRYSVDPSVPASGEPSPSTPATPVGFDGRPVHYLIPDMPAEQH